MTEMHFGYDVVIVTDAGRELGREHALAFARGAAVVVTDVMDGAGNSSAAHDVVAEIVAPGARGGGVGIGRGRDRHRAGGAQGVRQGRVSG